MTLGDRIVVFNAGKIEQVGSPLELCNRPANLFVAGFFGSPKMNFMPGRVAKADHGNAVPLEGGTFIALPVAATMPLAAAVTVSVRPEHLQFVPSGEGLPVKVDLVEHLDDLVIVYVSLLGHTNTLAVKLDGGHAVPAVGESIGIAVQTDNCHCFDSTGHAVR